METLWNRLSKPTQEAIKEFFRVILLAVIPVLISILMQPVFSWRATITTVLLTGAIAGLRYVDKLLHETGKEIEKSQTSDSPLTGGLTRF